MPNSDIEEEILPPPIIDVPKIDYPALMVKIHQEVTDFDEPITFNLCPREVWGALPPKNTPPPAPLKHPVSTVHYPDTATDTCVTPEECVPILKKIQKEHMDQGFRDIKYNFMVGGDGTIYEGRGWHEDADRPQDLDRFKGDCIDVAYIGDMEDNWQDECFPSPACEEYGYGWCVYGQQDNNYIKEHFDYIQ